MQGLDLLALRRTAARISESLLDGVTTITPTIRYLSFMCWITKSYWHKPNVMERRQYLAFARRAEAAIVFGNLLQEDAGLGMVGTVQARRTLESIVDPVPLEMSVQQLATSAYAAAAEQIRLLADATGGGVPHLTDKRGSPLANLVHDQVSATRIGRRIASGETIESASRADLLEFGAAVTMAGMSDHERDLLLDALLPPEPIDDRERNRIATYAAILSLTRSHSTAIRADDLLSVALTPLRTTPARLDGLMDGWALFAVRDVLAAAHEAVLASVLNELVSTAARGRGPVDANEVIGSVVARRGVQDAELREFGLLAPGETVARIGFREFADRVDTACSESALESGGLRRWSGPLDEVTLARRVVKSGDAALALLPVAWLLAEHRAEVGVRSGRPDFAALSWKGRTRFGLIQTVLVQLKELRERDAPVLQVMAELSRQTVDQHLRTAWARCAVDPTKDVSLLISDCDRWQPREKLRFRAGRAASRLDQAIGWTEQLGLSSDGTLTPQGDRILRRCMDTLERGPTS